MALEHITRLIAKSVESGGEDMRRELEEHIAPERVARVLAGTTHLSLVEAAAVAKIINVPIGKLAQAAVKK